MCVVMVKVVRPSARQALTRRSYTHVHDHNNVGRGRVNTSSEHRSLSDFIQFVNANISILGIHSHRKRRGRLIVDTGNIERCCIYKVSLAFCSCEN